MSEESSLPQLVEPQLGGSKHFLQVLDGPSQEILKSKWLIYKIPDWLKDESVQNCLNCDMKFSFVTRRHHCRACGGIYCSNCCSNALPLPQFNVSTPERLCNECVKRQHRIFEIKSDLVAKNEIFNEYNKKLNMLHSDFSELLKAGCSFVKYDEKGYYNIKLTYNDETKYVTEKYIHLNKVSKMNLSKITIKSNADPSISEKYGKALLSCESSCYTLTHDDQVFVYKPIKLDYGKWFDGLILAKFAFHFEHDFINIKEDINKISIELDSLIKSQTTFAISKVYKERESPLVLLDQPKTDTSEEEKELEKNIDEENLFEDLQQPKKEVPSIELIPVSATTAKDIAPKALKISSFSKTSLLSKTLPSGHKLNKYEDLENSQSQIEFWSMEEKTSRPRVMY